MAEYIEKTTLLNRVIIPSICSCVQGEQGKRLKKFCIDTVNSVSAADVAPVKRGEWAKKPFLIGTSYYCSECGDNFGEPYNYCPNCGAKMDEEVNNT